MKILKKSIILILFFLIMHSCYGAPNNPHADIWQELQSDSAANVYKEVTIQSTFPKCDWWKDFNDENLNNYVSSALANNFTLKAAIDRISEARAVVAQVKSIQRPSVSLQASYNRLLTSKNIFGEKSENGNLYSFPLSASYELDLFGKNKLKVQSAQKIEQETEKERQEIELIVSSEVASAYFNLLQADASIKTTNYLIDNTSKSVKLREQLFTGGVIPYDDVLLTEEELSQYRETLADYKNQRAEFAHQLNILTAIKPLNEKFVARKSIDQIDIPKNINLGVPSDLLKHRPDISESELALQKAHIDINEARKEFYPTIDLSADAGFASSVFTKWFDWGSLLYAAGGTISQSLYTGGFKTAYLKQQKATADEVLNNYYYTVLSAFNDVENSLALFNNNYSEFHENLLEIKSADHYANLAEVRYKYGVGTNLDYLDAQRQLLTYILLSEQNKGRSFVDIVSLYKALGGGYSQ